MTDDPTRTTDPADDSVPAALLELQGYTGPGTQTLSTVLTGHRRGPLLIEQFLEAFREAALAVDAFILFEVFDPTGPKLPEQARCWPGDFDFTYESRAGTSFARVVLMGLDCRTTPEASISAEIILNGSWTYRLVELWYGIFELRLMSTKLHVTLRFFPQANVDIIARRRDDEADPEA